MCIFYGMRIELNVLLVCENESIFNTACYMKEARKPRVVHSHKFPTMHMPTFRKIFIYTVCIYIYTHTQIH